MRKLSMLLWFATKKSLCFNKNLLPILTILCFSSFKTTALNYYWIGGSGNWSNLSHWATTSGGTILHSQIPTALDDVFFDNNSFSTAGQVVNFDAPTTLVHSINWTGTSGSPLMSGSNLIKIYGSLTFIPGLDITNLTGEINFESTSPGQTITMAGQHFNGTVNFNGIGGGWAFQDEFTTNYPMYLNAGALNFNDQQVNASAFYSSVTTTRSLNMGSSVFNISGSSNSCWIVKSPGLTLNCGTSVINFNNSAFASDMQGDNSGNLIFYDVNFTATSTTGLGGMSGIFGSHKFHHVSFHSPGRIMNSNTFNELTFDKDGELHANNSFNKLTFSPAYTYLLWNGTTQTDRKSTRLNSSHGGISRMPSSA